jgi:drug/metabolite transporter (DMT)-like permease
VDALGKPPAWWLAGLLFGGERHRHGHGCGWAISSSLPRLARDAPCLWLWWSGFTIVGIAGGILVFFARHERLERRTRGTAFVRGLRDARLFGGPAPELREARS